MKFNVQNVPLRRHSPARCAAGSFKPRHKPEDEFIVAGRRLTDKHNFPRSVLVVPPSCSIFFFWNTFANP